jgi:hypothetical protein
MLTAVPMQFVVASLTPETLEATLEPGESVSETKSVFLPGIIPKADVIFSFDLTGSMGDELLLAKSEAIDIMNSLDTLISDAWFSVTSFMDYPYYYNDYHDYSSTYGDSYYGDYPYHLDLSLTSDKTAVQAAINGLILGYGADGPESYTRALYESYSDPAVGWRTGTKRIVIMIGDAPPHDNNLNEGVPGKSGTWSTGGDPGRDEIAMTSDDLDLQTVLSEMNTNQVTLLFVLGSSHWPSDVEDYWDYWAGLTGGDMYQLASTGDIPEAIVALVGAEAAHIDTLTLLVEAGYESWLTSLTPSEYTDFNIDGGTTETFDITITVPPGTSEGTYVFDIWASGDGADYGRQTVTITVPGEEKVPPTIESYDDWQNIDNDFFPSDTIYVKGSGYPKEVATYDLYFVPDDSWTDGMTIPTPAHSTTVTTDANGDVPHTAAWSSPPSITVGAYDIVVDVNGNGVYDKDVDALDDLDVSYAGTNGFFVIPELPIGTLMGLASCLAALGIILKSKRGLPR